MSDLQSENVWPPAPSLNETQEPDPVLKILEFKRQSTWLVFFASVLTLGIGAIIWFYLAARQSKRIWPEKGFSPDPFLVLLLTYLALLVMEYSRLLTLSMLYIADIVFIIAIPTTIILFQIRINELLGSDKTKNYWMKAMAPLLIGAYCCTYTNYKINRAIDAAKALQSAE